VVGSLLVLCLIASNLHGIEADDEQDEIAEAIEAILEDAHEKGSLTKGEFDELVTKVYNLDKALIRCYNMNKKKDRSKLVSRMKLLVAPKHPIKKPAAEPERVKQTTKTSIPMKKTSSPLDKLKTIKEEYTDRIEALYKTHNPTKVNAVANLLSRSKGKEHKLYERICAKYGVTPKAEYHEPVIESETLLAPDKWGNYEPEDIQKMFERMAEMSEDSQESALQQLMANFQKDDRMKKMLEEQFESEEDTFKEFMKMRTNDRAQYDQVMKDMPGAQRLMMEIFMRLKEQSNAEEASPKEKKKVKKTNLVAEEEAAADSFDVEAYMKKFKATVNKKEFNAQDIMRMFTELGEMSRPKQNKAVKYLIQHFKKIPNLKNMKDTLDKDAIKQFFKLKEMRASNPEQYEQVTQQIPAQQKLMMEVFSEVVETTGALDGAGKGGKAKSHTEL